MRGACIMQSGKEKGINIVSEILEGTLRIQTNKWRDMLKKSGWGELEAEQRVNEMTESFRRDFLHDFQKELPIVLQKTLLNEQRAQHGGANLEQSAVLNADKPMKKYTESNDVIAQPSNKRHKRT